MEQDLSEAIELAETMVDLFGPDILTDAFWAKFRKLVEEVARSPVVGAKPN